MLVHDDVIFIKRFIKINRKLEGNAEANQRAWRFKATFFLIKVNQVEKMTAFEDCSFKVVHLTESPKATNCHRFDMRSLYQSGLMLEIHLRTVWGYSGAVSLRNFRRLK